MNRVMSEIVHTFKQVLGEISPRVTVEKVGVWDISENINLIESG